MLYGGSLTADDWTKIVLEPGDVSFEASNMVGVAGSWQYSSAYEERLLFEVEASVVRHFGAQEHFEFNVVPLAARWQAFPWSKYVATTFGMGGGLSYASEPPVAEIIVRREAEQLLFHWYLELTAGPPGRQWEIVGRLHHRSGGFGVLGEPNEVGSDFLTAGLRWWFR